MPPSIDEPIYKPHEARIHESVFDTLSRPLLSRNGGDGGSRQSSVAFPIPFFLLSLFKPHQHPTRFKSPQTHAHITWNHFGQKHHIHLSQSEMASNQNLLELLHSKVRVLVPEFRAKLAYKDQFGHEVLLHDDRQLRDLFAGNKRIRLFTTLTGTFPGHLAASELGRSRTSSVAGSEANSETNLLQRACDDLAGRGGNAGKKKPPSSVPPSPSPSQQQNPILVLHPEQSPRAQLLPFIGYGSGNVAAVQPQPYSADVAHLSPVPSFCCCATQCCRPVFVRGSWIGPNKFWGGGSWGGGGGLWGGIGQIPSGRYWHTAAGGRPPW